MPRNRGRRNIVANNPRRDVVANNAFSNDESKDESKGDESGRWGRGVHTLFIWDEIEDQIRNKVNEIAEDVGRGSHGEVTFSNGTTCQHWRAGNFRIFGTYSRETQLFTFIGWGTHSGRGNSRYAVELSGGRTRAQTS